MIAANVQLISNNHDLYERQIITCKPVHIGKNAWIGAGATVLPGVTIGDNAVVGAASVVTKDVAADTIVAGNPAKFIKRIPASSNVLHPMKRMRPYNSDWTVAETNLLAVTVRDRAE